MVRYLSIIIVIETSVNPLFISHPHGEFARVRYSSEITVQSRRRDQKYEFKRTRLHSILCRLLVQ